MKDEELGTYIFNWKDGGTTRVDAPAESTPEEVLATTGRTADELESWDWYDPGEDAL